MFKIFLNYVHLIKPYKKGLLSELKKIDISYLHYNKNSVYIEYKN